MRTKETSKFFLGIDVSKLTLDISLMCVHDHQKQPIKYCRLNNSAQGMKQLERWLKQNAVLFSEQSMVVIENTGIYHRVLWDFCSKKGLPVYIGNAADIKWSFGIARGKNDKIDSARLCSYAQKHAEDLKATPALDPELIKLKDLMTSRNNLLSNLNSIKVYLKELKGINNKSTQQTLESAYESALNGLKQSLAAVESELNKIITTNNAFKKNYDLLTSIPGIGRLTAVYMICCTANFAGNITGKQLASYAGVVPFEHTSGSSIRKKSRLHKMANKELKKMLHLCAMSAIQHHQEFKQYYERKKKEGKNSMSILNAIRNKLVLRAVAVVKKGQPYVNNLQVAA